MLQVTEIQKQVIQTLGARNKGRNQENCTLSKCYCIMLLKRGRERGKNLCGDNIDI